MEQWTDAKIQAGNKTINQVQFQIGHDLKDKFITSKMKNF